MLSRRPDAGKETPNGVTPGANGKPDISSGVCSDGGSQIESHPTIASNDTKAVLGDADEDEDDKGIPEPEKPDFSKEDLPDDEYFKFTKQDLIGDRPSTAFQSPALGELKRLIGLKEVKKAVNSMVSMLETNYERELQELAPINLTLNQVFYGTPGTGKTTVAKLYGQILASLSLLSDGEVVVKNPSDFIGDAVGMSESNTRSILAATVGKVLVIDEAYMLASGVHGQGGGSSGGGGSSYGASVIDTIMAEVQGVPGEDRCIILVGYEDRLKDMFQHANPGLARRFRIGRGFRFDNLTTPELMRILHKKMRDEDLRATPQALEVAQEMLERAQSRASFSNAGEVVNLLDIAKMNFQARVQRETDRAKRFENMLRPEDFEPDYKRRLDAADNCRRRLGGRVSEAILAKLLDWIRKAEVARSAKIPLAGLVPTRFVIRGPPGTGKRTAAREVGRVFYDIGFLGTAETVEKSVSDLLGQYVGQTAPKTRAVIERCLGKALFVRDAARLAETSSYAAEAVGELDSLLSSPKCHGKLVVVLAGTAQEMDGLLASRPALARLFRDDVASQPLTPDESLAMLRRTLRMKGVEVATTKGGQVGNEVSEWEGKVKALWSSLAGSPKWENAMTVQALADKLAEPVLGSWQERMVREANEPRAAKESTATAHLKNDETGKERKGDEEEEAVTVQLNEEEDGLAMDEVDELKQTHPTTRGILPAEQVVKALKAAIEDHGTKRKTTRTARKKKAAAASIPKATQQEEDFRQQQQPPAVHSAHRHGALQRPKPRRRTSHSHGPTAFSAGPLPGPQSLTPPPEASVTAEKLREVQRQFAKSKAKQADETAAARRTREKDEAAALKAIAEMGVCPNGFGWFRDGGIWQCTGGAHRVSDKDIKDYLMNRPSEEAIGRIIILSLEKGIQYRGLLEVSRQSMEYPAHAVSEI